MRRSQSGECHVRVYECSLVRYMQNVTSACQSTARNRHESISSTRHAWYVCARASCHVCRVRTVSFLRRSAVYEKAKSLLPHRATAAGLADSRATNKNSRFLRLRQGRASFHAITSSAAAARAAPCHCTAWRTGTRNSNAGAKAGARSGPRSSRGCQNR
jgi:hypothetical protein